MSWTDNLPEGIGNVEETKEGFSAQVGLPTTEDGWFGRKCPECELLFKMNVGSYPSTPEGEEVALTCPYCGHHGGQSHFLTPDQVNRSRAALVRTTQEWMRKQFGRGGRYSRQLPMKITFKPSSLQALPDYVEDAVRRTLECEKCGTAFAVYGSAPFCPNCGERPLLTTTLESVAALRQLLSIEDSLEGAVRDSARDHGVFDQAARDVIKQIVTLCEVFMRGQFAERAPDHESIVRTAGRGVFQRLDDTNDLFAAHAGFALSSLVSDADWIALGAVFQQRHVLVHRNGTIDQQFVDRVPNTTQRVGQRLIVGRQDAEHALDTLEELVTNVAGQ
jgi:hypothetical protein